MISLDVARRLAQALRPAKPDVAETSGGVVTRLDNDGTVWVQLHGADEDTPCTSRTAAVHVGDAVTVTIDGGSARVDGNVTRPATDDERADEAHELAVQATEEVSEVRETATATARLTAIANGIAEQAQAVADAINQHFWADTNGVHVTEAEGDPTTEHNILINSLGILLRHATDPLVSITQSAIAFYDGLGSAASNIVASFGSSGFQVGMEDESHLVGDYHSLQLVDKEGNTYFYVSDLRDSTGSATVVETFEGDGTKTQFSVDCDVLSSSASSVTVDGISVSFTRSEHTFTLSSAPTAGAEVVITYPSDDSKLKAYTFGKRDTGAIGAYSIAEGDSTVASGYSSHAEGNSRALADYSHAEGRMSYAEGMCSHAEGMHAQASGSYSHAEGEDAFTAGRASHAGGYNTSALGDYQTVIGKFNAEDYSDTYAFIVGNGTDDNNRSNAFAVQWDGTMEAAKPLPVASGGTGITDYGTYQVNDDDSGVSVANNAWTTVNQLTLGKGRWLLRYDVEFPSNATGWRGCGISTASGSIGAANLRQSGITVPAANGAGTRLNGSRIVNPTGSTTYYLVVRQNSGSALTTTSYIQAVKIG